MVTQLTEGVDVLADAVRRLLEVMVRTKASPADVAAAAAAITQATELLEADLREGPWSPDHADPLPSPYNAVVGAANPLAAPAVLTTRTPEGVTGTVRFGTVYEGAPGLVHGGMLAMVLDQFLGEAAVIAGVGGMTTKLEIRYAAATPINADLTVTARVVEAGERFVTLEGSIAYGDITSVTAVGTFIRLTREQAERLFPHLARE